MTVLILVMSAQKEPWGSLMNAQMETWDKDEHPQTRTIYYVGGGIPANWKPVTRWEESQTFYSDISENLEDVSRRTIEAFEETLRFENWDYMARVHSSTYVHKDNLVKFCHTLRRHNVLCGLKTDGVNPFLWGGGHYIFSRDVIHAMVNNKDAWNHTVMEDLSITQMAELLDIPITHGHTATINLQRDGSYLCFVYGHGENFTFRDFSEINKADGHFFFRVKHDPDRSQDIRIMHELKKHLS